MSSAIALTLAQAAKSAGGDKYKIMDWEKESFIYVPQNISRASPGAPAEKLTMKISSDPVTDDTPHIVFELVKQGKTGDDRYKAVNEAEWKGDIYLPHNYRNPAGKINVVVSLL